MQTFDHVIIGTGQATGTLLGKLIPTKSKIAVIEANEVGGSCVNYGCTPTKTLVASAKAIHMARRGDFYGFEAEPKVDFKRVMARMNEIRNAGSKGLRSWMENTRNVTFMQGYASFVQNKVLEVNGEQLTAKNIYINVGTRPSAPPISGLEKVNWLDSAGLLDLESLPRHLLIIGGGYIGVEFAQVFKRLGAQITLIQRGNQLMPQEDEDVARSIQNALEAEGIAIKLHANARQIEEKNGVVAVTIEQHGQTGVLEGDRLLVAAGRRPNSDTLALENTSIERYERGYIKVDDHCQTAVAGVYALGDVNGHGAFTHTSVNDAEIVLDHLFGGNRSISQRIPIYGLFTDPPLGRVGMSEKEALQKGYKVLKAERPMRKISRAIEMGETQGLAKLLVDAKTDLILGASVHGPGGDEIINMFAAIMHSKIPCRHYRKVVLVHPTVSELMPWVLDELKPIN
jgi:pyruvate/2-oxoglutarate dehydrogenase complex dihydrolipoamide dehydrogenase (E3) component